MKTKETSSGLSLPKKCLIWWVSGALLIFSACANVGPRSIQRDRFDYNGMVAQSWQEQTLLNIVKTRYFDLPVFLDVAQIVSGYNLESSVALGGVDYLGSSSDSVNLGVNGKWTDRPTITYTPLTGTQFNRSLMTPIPPTVVLFMFQSGWNVSKIFKLTVDTINDVKCIGPDQAKFLRLIELMADLQKKDRLNMRVEKREKGKPAAVLILRSSDAGPEDMAKANEIREILGLKPDQDEFKVNYGPIGRGDNTIGMKTRSMMQIMVALSTRVDIAAQDLDEGRALSVPDAVNVLFHDFKILQAAEKPENALVAVPYRGRWFWIDDRDMDSKLIFALVMILNTQMESGSAEGMPLVTIPAG